MTLHISKVMDTRSAEIMSALLAIMLAISTFTAPETSPINVVLDSVLPQWAYMNIVCAVFCLMATFIDTLRINTAARFMSGCFWGTVLAAFAEAGQFIPVFWMAVVMFAFDVYLVTIKGQTWSRSNS